MDSVIARIATDLPCTEAELWAKIRRPESLQYVAAPLLSFTPVEAGGLDGEWVVGRDYDLNLCLFHVIPLGRHRITLVQIDPQTNTIVSRERGRVARVWNHTITFHSFGAKGVRYTDRIEIHAGLLTPLIWAFAHLFYRHRQRRWKLLLEQEPR